MNFKIRHFRNGDAESTARMLNESEQGWPGGLTGGVKYTAERVLDWIRRVKSFAPLVAECEGRIVGICTVTEHYEDEEAAYIEFLNVHPEYRGKGIGKSLLLEAIGESIQAGYRRVDLHTWSGNLNAIPVYKKTGFHWVPGTSVYMQNYIPMVLNHPLVKPFIEKHGLSHPAWYGRLVRELDLREDDYRIEGLKAFPYRLRAGGGEVLVVVDREARDIAMVETPWLKASMTVEMQDAPAGFPQKVTWMIMNNSDRPVTASVRAEPVEDVIVGPVSPDTLTIKPGEEAFFKAVVKPRVEAEYRDEQEKAWRLRSTVIIQGLKIPLCVGLRIKQPATVWISPYPFTTWQGGGGTLNINLKSELKESCIVKLGFTASTGVYLNRHCARVKLTQSEYSGVPVRIDTPKPGAYRLTINPVVEAGGLKVQCKPVSFNIRVHDGSTVLYGYEGVEKNLVAGNGSLIVMVSTRRGSSMQILERDTLSSMIRGVIEGIGPPYWPSEFERKRFKFTVYEAANGLIIRMECNSDKYKGLTMVKEILIPRGSHIVRLRYGFRNATSRELIFKLGFRCWMAPWGRYYAVPLKQGVVRSYYIEGDFPYWEGDLPKKQESYREGWVALEDGKGVVSAVMWGSAGEVDLGSGRVGLTFPVKVKPYRDSWLQPIHFYVGPGTWVNVSRAWRKIYMGLPADYVDEKPKHTRPVRLTFSPVVLDRGGEVKLTVENLRLRGQSGTLTIDPPEGWSFKPLKLNIEDLSLGKPFTRTIEVNPHCRPGAYHAVATLKLEGTIRRFTIPIVLASGPGVVKVEEGEFRGHPVFNVDNGYLKFTVARSLGAPIVSLHAEGDELLYSSFPNPRPYSWYGSWLGGISLFGTEQTLFKWSLQREEWNVEKRMFKGWVGVSAACKPILEVHRKIWGLKLGVEYLTKPMARLLLLRITVENTTGARRTVNPVLGVYLRLKRPGGEYRYVLPGEYETIRRQGRYYAWALSPNNHIIAYNTSGWPYITLVTDGMAKPVMSDEAEGEGGNLNVFGIFRLKPYETKTHTVILSISKSMNEARNYGLLAKYPADSWFSKL